MAAQREVALPLRARQSGAPDHRHLIPELDELGLVDAARHWLEQPPLPVARGAEVGRFNMGSTVVVLLGSNEFRFSPGLSDGLAVRMGQALGSFA